MNVGHAAVSEHPHTHTHTHNAPNVVRYLVMGSHAKETSEEAVLDLAAAAAKDGPPSLDDVITLAARSPGVKYR